MVITGVDESRLQASSWPKTRSEGRQSLGAVPYSLGKLAELLQELCYDNSIYYCTELLLFHVSKRKAACNNAKYKFHSFKKQAQEKPR